MVLPRAVLVDSQEAPVPYLQVPSSSRDSENRGPWGGITQLLIFMPPVTFGAFPICGDGHLCCAQRIWFQIKAFQNLPLGLL